MLESTLCLEDGAELEFVEVFLLSEGRMFQVVLVGRMGTLDLEDLVHVVVVLAA